MLLWWLFSLMLLFSMLVLTEKLTHKLGLIWSGYTLFILILFIWNFLSPISVSGTWILLASLHHLLLIGVSLQLERLYQDFKNLVQRIALSEPQRKNS